MCRAVTCKTCGKTSWTGCGRHVDQVMAGVPMGERCPGHAPEHGQRGSWLARVFGR